MLKAPKPRGVLKTTPEDFRVEEIPVYLPCGEGDHLFVRFTKRGLTTDDAARRIARATGVDLRDVGIAGMKDKVAVTTQTISLPVPPKAGAEFDDRVRMLAIDGVSIEDARRHGNKLKTGHLLGNRFAIVVRGIPRSRAGEVVAEIERVGREGLPNAFGPQRFGRAGDNTSKARAWLSGQAPAPRDRRLARLLFSSLQAELFNRVLDLRVADGTWTTPQPGDLVKRRRGHALFEWAAADAATVDDHAEGPASPTGPMFGVKMREPSGAPGELERAVLRDATGASIDWSAARAFGEGTRRSLRLWIDELRAEIIDEAREASPGEQDPPCGIEFHFVLPKGGYATSVLGTALALEPDREGSPGASQGTEAGLEP